MAKISKKEFFDYMSTLYEEKYNDQNGYKVLIDILEHGDDPKFIKKMRDIVSMTSSQKRIYRYQLAVQGREFTPRQVDQYISLIEYALEHLD